MTVCDPAKLDIADSRGRLQRAKSDRPSDLQCAQIILRKRFPGEVNRRDRKLLLVERAEVIGQQPYLFELRRSCGDGFAKVGKPGEFGLGSARYARPARTSRAAFGALTKRLALVIVTGLRR